MRYKKDFVKPDGRTLLKGGPRDQQLRAKAMSETAALTDNLIEQITELKSQVKNLESGVSPDIRGLYTPEQVDEEIRKAVSQAMAEATISLKKSGPDPNVELLIKKYKEQIVQLQSSNDNFVRMHKSITNENSGLKEELDKAKQSMEEVVELRKNIAVLEQELAGKEELVETLKTRPAIINGEIMMSEDPDRPKMEQKFVDPIEDGADDGLKSNITNREITRDVDDGEVDDKVNRLKDLLGGLPKIT